MKKNYLLIISLIISFIACPINVMAQEYNSDYLDGRLSMTNTNTYHGIILSDDNLYMWGNNAHGQLGNGTKEKNVLPTKVEGLPPLKQFSVSETHCIALSRDGEVFTWGSNEYGQLGNGVIGGESLTPIKVQGISGATQVSAGWNASGVVMSNGDVYVFGYNEVGYTLLGKDKIVDRNNYNLPSPTRIENLSNIKSISFNSCGPKEYAALSKNGEMFIWGNVSYGTKNTFNDDYMPITKVQIPEKVIKIATPSSAFYAITESGSLYSWGYNYGQLGYLTGEAADSIIKTPKKVEGLPPISDASGAFTDGMAIARDGSVYTWGNYETKLGFGRNSNLPSKRTPNKLENLNGAIYSAAADDISTAILKNGDFYIWGSSCSGLIENYDYKPYLLIKNLDPSKINTGDLDMSESDVGLTHNGVESQEFFINKGESLVLKAPFDVQEWFSDNESIATVKAIDGTSATIQGINDGITSIYAIKAGSDTEDVHCNVIVGQQTKGHELSLGTDILKVDNGFSDPSNLVERNDFGKFLAKFDPSEWDRLVSVKESHGHCYGLALVTVLHKINCLPKTKLDNYPNLYSAEIDDEIKTLVCEYWRLQNSDAAMKIEDELMDNYKTWFGFGWDSKQVLQELERAADNVQNDGIPPVISLDDTEDFHHTIVGYRVEDVNYTSPYGKKINYDKCIRVYDPNMVDSNGIITSKYSINEFNIYYKSDYSAWEIPIYNHDENDQENHYQASSYGKVKISYFLDEPQELDPVNILSSSDTKNSEPLQQRIFVSRNSPSLTITNTVTGKSWKIDPKTLNIEGNERLKYYMPHNGLNDELAILLPDNEPNYKISSESNLELEYKNSDIYTKVENQVKEIEIKNDSIKVNSINGDFNINYANDNIPKSSLPHYNLVGNGQGSIELKAKTNGLDVKSNNLDNLEVTGENLSKKSNTLKFNKDNTEININNSGETLQSDQNVSSNPNTPNQPSQNENILIYRLYNEGTKEHLFTSDLNEYNTLPSVGWTQEGVGWNAPSSGSPVYRLYSPVTRNHLFTTDLNEKNVLSSQGWQVDNSDQPLFYSDGNVPIYRLYHEGIRQHLLTKDANEYNILGGNGWNQEGQKLSCLS